MSHGIHIALLLLENDSENKEKDCVSFLPTSVPTYHGVDDDSLLYPSNLDFTKLLRQVQYKP